MNFVRVGNHSLNLDLMVRAEYDFEPDGNTPLIRFTPVYGEEVMLPYPDFPEGQSDFQDLVDILFTEANQW